MIVTAAGGQIMTCKLSSALHWTHTETDQAQLRLLLHAQTKARSVYDDQPPDFLQEHNLTILARMQDLSLILSNLLFLSL